MQLKTNCFSIFQIIRTFCKTKDLFNIHNRNEVAIEETRPIMIMLIICYSINNDIILPLFALFSCFCNFRFKARFIHFTNLVRKKLYKIISLSYNLNKAFLRRNTDSDTLLCGSSYVTGQSHEITRDVITCPLGL